jgi:hypothetical protein
MPAYRAYLLSNDHIQKPPYLIEAGDDGAAVEQARQLVDGHDVELWLGDKCLAVLKRPRKT